MTAYQRKILENIAEATYSRDYCQQKAWEYVGMRKDSTTAEDYFESVKSWEKWLEKLAEMARQEGITQKDIKKAIDKKYRAMQETA